MNNLKCSVVNCVYNQEYHCTADAIDVYTSDHGLASSSSGTACRTFKPRNNFITMGFK